MSVEKLTIDVRKLIKAGLSIEQHFILECIHKNYQDLVDEYVQNVGKFDKSAIISLIEKEYIQQIKDEITFNKLRLSKKGVDYFGSDTLNHKQFFKELREIYPKRVKVGKSFRSLHQNLENIEKKYKAIVTSRELHENILKCVKLYIRELESTNRLEYIQMLSTWINEKNYLTYIDEAISNPEIISNEDNYNAI